jgi:hypothetical protein
MQNWPRTKYSSTKQSLVSNKKANWRAIQGFYLKHHQKTEDCVHFLHSPGPTPVAIESHKKLRSKFIDIFLSYANSFFLYA